jgi:hypothetical protein
MISKIHFSSMVISIPNNTKHNSIQQFLIPFEKSITSIHIYHAQNRTLP